MTHHDLLFDSPHSFNIRILIGVRKNAHGKKVPRKITPRKLPPSNLPPGKLPSSQENCPPKNWFTSFSCF